MSAEATTASAATAPNGWPRWVLAGFREGETRALTEVYRLHAPQIARNLRFGFAFDSGGRSHRFVGYGSGFELHDALHETFRRAFEPKARLAYDGLRPYGPYLATIARNVVLRGFRAGRRRFVELDESSGPATEAADPAFASPEAALGRRQVQQLVRDFMAELTEAERQLLAVRFVDGKSQRDAADELGIGRQQVRSREVKLRRRLVAYLRRRDAGFPATALASWAWMVHAAWLVEAIKEGLIR